MWENGFSESRLEKYQSKFSILKIVAVELSVGKRAEGMWGRILKIKFVCKHSFFYILNPCRREWLWR